MIPIIIIYTSIDILIYVIHLTTLNLINITQYLES